MSTAILENSPLHKDSKYASATLLSTASNFITNADQPFTRTYRTYIRLREYGSLQFRLWHSNAVDSTWDLGKDARAGEPGGSWRIEAAYLADGGLQPDGSIAIGSEAAVTFKRSVSKDVAPGEKFWSDEVSLFIPDNHYLCLSWTISTKAPGKSIPFNVEQMLATAYDAPGRLAHQASSCSFERSNNQLVLPSFIGYKKNTAKQLVFFGDSITQGVRTSVDAYEYWAARIGDELGTDYGIWNLGSGWARAYDAAGDGPWLFKAKQADEIVIALGVNDLDIGQRKAPELIQDLTSVIAAIKNVNPSAIITLCTVPPFNFTDDKEQARKTVNQTIRMAGIPGADRVFDLAAVLSVSKPNEHRVRPNFMSSQDDPHPNGLAGQAVSRAFLDWYVQYK
ncbi:GDSL family lipase [Paenibacillus sp. CAA11]|uniref:SGNH/GDSL hydrolase family protein n=1 Tax=Paenibacillus sp. CAA11 TaxID=1532905 RepID=UPI000D364A8B|nr:SGNH/GDSL hydrolase family protein [Paenibacillus sp. CAA11]AWB44203.1 GDSL family lipase [Paenibacillus sp. CAA11]